LQESRTPLAELLTAFEDIKRVGITHTNRIPSGEYGEWLACHLLDLTPADSKVSTGGDGFDQEGRGYEVKTKAMASASRTPSIRGKNVGDFDYLVAVSLSPDYEFQALRLLPANELEWSEKSFSFGPKQADICQVITPENLPADKRGAMGAADACMRRYKECLTTLIEMRVIRSEKTLSADLGEFYVSCYFELDLVDNVNQPGFDALDTKGRRYQIKSRMPTPTGVGGEFQDCFTTRTSFDFGKGIPEPHQFHTLVGCFLDTRLKPIAFLLAPYETVTEQIFGRASKSGKPPSPRYRWNWKQFLANPQPGVEIYLTQQYRDHATAFGAAGTVHVLDF